MIYLISGVTPAVTPLFYARSKKFEKLFHNPYAKEGK